jgi:prepilin-type N-terminal cleavage/methylation domain-containing protein
MGPFWRSRNGFTTIEVIAVLIIIGVIAAVVVAKISDTSSYNVQSVAEELKNHLRYAQNRAMNSNVIWGVYFISTTQYTIFKDGDSSHTVTPPGADSNTVDLSGRGVSLGNLGSNIVSFDDWGRPYTDATATTLQTATRCITVGGAACKIQITENTGYIP